MSLSRSLLQLLRRNSNTLGPSTITMSERTWLRTIQDETTSYEKPPPGCSQELADLIQVGLIRSFWNKGPNGRHLCLALELAGPKVGDYAKYRPSGALTISEIQKMGLGTAKALAYLHINRYVHGGKQVLFISS